jgi:hypothetical protein
LKRCYWVGVIVFVVLGIAIVVVTDAHFEFTCRHHFDFWSKPANFDIAGSALNIHSVSIVPA